MQKWNEDEETYLLKRRGGRTVAVGGAPMRGSADFDELRIDVFSPYFFSPSTLDLSFYS